MLTACRNVFSEEGVADLSKSDSEQLSDWFQRGRAGEPLTVVSPVCADYATEYLSDGSIRYTFDGVDCGIGLAAKRLYGSLPRIDALFRDGLGLRQLEYVVCVADYEGFSEAILRRVSLSGAEFAERMVQQCEALRSLAPISIKAYLLSDFFGGRSIWEPELYKMRLRFEMGEFTGVITPDVVRAIADERANLYRRFCQEPLNDLMLKLIVVNQGAEYATAGKFIASNCRNPLVLAAGNPKWGLFFRAHCSIPVLYLTAEHI